MRTRTKNEKRDAFLVVHPLDDLPEEKRDVSALGRMPMTLSVRLSLIALRVYLILMIGLVVYHFLGLAQVFKRVAH